MYAVGHGIKPWLAPRAGGLSSVRRLLAAVAAVSLFGGGLALGAHGSTSAGYATGVVQPGDTLWAVAVEHYPAGDVRGRVDDVAQANGLAGPTIQAVQTL